MLRTSDVTACLVTRGDVDMQPILDSLIFDKVIVWDNSVCEDMKTAGRYATIHQTTTPVVYFQDDDVIVPASTQEALLAEYEPGVMTAVYAHGDNADGYDDVPLVGAGAVVDRLLPLQAVHRYRGWPMDNSFLYYCDFAIGVLYPRVKQLRLPFEIVMEVAQHPSRLCNQPWAAAMKFEVTERARAIRDMTVAA